MHVIVRLGGIGTINKPLVNRGLIAGGFAPPGPFGSRLSFSTIQNLGTIEARGGPLRLDGTFTRADLGNLQWGTNGVFQIGPFATLNNAGQTFHVEVGKPWYLNGKIVGGTINVDQIPIFKEIFKGDRIEFRSCAQFSKRIPSICTNHGFFRQTGMRNKSQHRKDYVGKLSRRRVSEGRTLDAFGPKRQIRVVHYHQSRHLKNLSTKRRGAKQTSPKYFLYAPFPWRFHRIEIPCIPFAVHGERLHFPCRDFSFL
jgi:hypothetical protein